MLSTLEVRLTLTDNLVDTLRNHAQNHGLSEAMVVEQALNQFFALDESPVMNDYWFSVATMRKDWDATPDDWMVDEVANAIPTR